MTPPSAAPEPTPLPIRELPAEIEAAMQELIWASYAARPYVTGGTMTEEKKAKLERDSAAYYDAIDAMRCAIRAALDERDTALRERAERLRRVADVAASCRTTPDIVLERLADLHEDDYADDLRPRGGDVLT